MKHIVKPAFSLFIVAALSAVSLGVVYNVMADPIAENQRRTRERVLREILTEATEFVEAPEVLAETSDSRIRIERVFEGRSEGATVGYVVEIVTGAGYGGDIIMMVGILSAQNRIAGVRVLRHSETPGFGAVISRESFFRRFDGRSLIPLAVVRRAEADENEFQAITSSTITTNAIVGAVNEAIEWHNAQGGQR